MADSRAAPFEGSREVLLVGVRCIGAAVSSSCVDMLAESDAAFSSWLSSEALLWLTDMMESAMSVGNPFWPTTTGWEIRNMRD